MLRQLSQVKKITIGEEFRAKTPNGRQLKIQSDFSGTPVYIKCVSATGVIEPTITQPDPDNCCVIIFPEHFLMGTSYHFVIDELEKVVKTYEKPPVKKSIAGQQYFRAEVRKSQESLNQVFGSSSAVSFDQSYFTRTVGQIVIQHRVEEKQGKMVDNFGVFSGSGFGSLQAFNGALGYDTEELFKWYTGELLGVIKAGWKRKIYEFTTSVILNHNHDRMKSKKIEKEIRYYFKSKGIKGSRTERDLTINDCRKDVYIPAWDISRRTITVTKKTYPDMPIYVAVCATLIDPLFFDRKPMFPGMGMGIMAGDVTKNNDGYLKKYNPGMNILSIGCPVRIFDKGTKKIDERSKYLKITEIKHDTDLDWSRSCGSKRLECSPIDEYFQFATGEKAIQTAQKSGDIDV